MHLLLIRAGINVDVWQWADWMLISWACTQHFAFVWLRAALINKSLAGNYIGVNSHLLSACIRPSTFESMWTDSGCVLEHRKKSTSIVLT